MTENGKIEKNTDIPALDRWRLDEVLEPNRPIWGLDHIAKVLGLSRDTVRKLAKLPQVPIYQPEGYGSYFAFRSELLAWLKSKPTNGNQRISTFRAGGGADLGQGGSDRPPGECPAVPEEQ